MARTLFWKILMNGKVTKSNWRGFLLGRLDAIEEMVSILLSIVPPDDGVASETLLHIAMELSTAKTKLVEE